MSLTFHITVLTTNTTQTSMPPVGFEPTIPVSERPKTHALDRTASGIGSTNTYVTEIVISVHSHLKISRNWFAEFVTTVLSSYPVLI
jgi:hypothetical protein